ncbi:MAG: hypothetical protein DWB93_05705 [Candidatus Poseidoniales archaeon]|nr:MAG: hypothetical protein DWB93_05705 [Candidatus Poseidoniales archaeon]
MERKCNIDAKGKLFRFTIGMFSVISGIVIISLFNLNIFLSEEILLMGIFSIIGGLFAIWEAREGWCIVRAIGIRTPF